MVPPQSEEDKQSCPRPQLKVQQTLEEDTAVPTPPQLLAVAQGQRAGHVPRTQHFSHGYILPFSPLPSCPFHHTEFFILGEFGLMGNRRHGNCCCFTILLKQVPMGNREVTTSLGFFHSSRSFVLEQVISWAGRILVLTATQSLFR